MLYRVDREGALCKNNNEKATMRALGQSCTRSNRGWFINQNQCLVECPKAGSSHSYVRTQWEFIRCMIQDWVREGMRHKLWCEPGKKNAETLHAFTHFEWVNPILGSNE